MTRLIWDARPYEYGLDRGVYYAPGGVGEPWNGLVDVGESPSEGSPLTTHIDGVRVYRKTRRENFEGTITAFTVPDSFFEDQFAQKRRRNFGMSYRTSTATSYKIHLIYNVLLGPSGHLYKHDEVEPFSWDFSTRPLPVPGGARSAHLIVDAETAWPAALAALEDVLYGTDGTDAMLPEPIAVADIFDLHALIKITDHGDGTWTAEGPDEYVRMLDATTFEITSPAIDYISADTYTIRSW